MPPPLRIGVSACLLGQAVRFDGQHKRNHFLTDHLGKHVEWLAICPELEVGMGVPRESVRLVRGEVAAPRLAAPRSGTDWTERMNHYARARVAALAREQLCGYVLKRGSPSCGRVRIRVYPASGDGPPTRDGVGLFAAALLAAFPDLPIEEEGRLEDARLRESFVERVFAYHRVGTLFAGPWTLGDLVRFHTAEKMALLAHATEGYRALGRLVATGAAVPRATLAARYRSEFMAILGVPSTPGRHANVLMHMLGHLRDRLDPDARRELFDLIDEHRRGLVPLVVPLTLLRHHVRRLDVGWLRAQSYLSPHPRELMLRNHV